MQLSKTNVSVHGQALLKILSEPTTGNTPANSSKCLEYIAKDALAGKLKSRELGNTAFHYLMHDSYPDAFVLPILAALIQGSSGGAAIKNNAGSYPLHYAMQRSNDIHVEIVKMLVSACTEALLAVQTPIPATLPPPQVPQYTLPPPFLLYLQRNKYKVDVELCEYIIHACPQVVKHKDAYGNYPLHTACSKSPYTQYAGEYTADHPCNQKLIKLLLEAFPAAASFPNVDMAWPLHLLCGNTSKVANIKPIYSAFPDAVKVQDKGGRSCLHLAVTAIQRIYNHKIVTAEDAELFRLMDMQSAMKISHKGKRGGNKESVAALKDEMEKLGISQGKLRSASEVVSVEDEEYGEEEQYEDENEDEGKKEEGAEEKEQEVTTTAAFVSPADVPVSIINRQQIVQYLADLHPDALLYLNKGAQTPVESVLEGARPIVGATRLAKHPKGLIVTPTDDLPTSRVLLLLQKRLSVSNSKIELKARYINPLIELNWLARKFALFLSLECVVRPLTPGCTACSSTVKNSIKDKDTKKGKATAVKGKAKHLAKGKSNAGAKASAASASVSSLSISAGGGGGDPGTPTITSFHKSNMLAKLRNRGQIDCIRIIIEFI